MKAIKIKEMPPNITSYYDHNSYPESGIYESTGFIYMVNKELVSVWSGQISEKWFTEVSSGISENTLLKAIAISQRPELAKDLD